MKKHEEIARLDSCLNSAHDNEPLFILRGKDPAAPAAIRAWTEERIALGINTRSDDKMVSAATVAQEMEAYQQQG